MQKIFPFSNWFVFTPGTTTLSPRSVASVSLPASLGPHYAPHSPLSAHPYMPAELPPSADLCCAHVLLHPWHPTGRAILGYSVTSWQRCGSACAQHRGRLCQSSAPSIPAHPPAQMNIVPYHRE